MARRLSLTERVAGVIEQRDMATVDTPVLLMVSGGSDSTALAYVVADLVAARRLGAVAMLHVNHKLRGGASDGDARFVSELANSLGFPLFMCDIDVAGLVARSGGNMELLRRWVQEGMATPAEDMARAAEAIMFHGMEFLKGEPLPPGEEEHAMSPAPAGGEERKDVPT